MQGICEIPREFIPPVGASLLPRVQREAHTGVVDSRCRVFRSHTRVKSPGAGRARVSYPGVVAHGREPATPVGDLLTPVAGSRTSARASWLPRLADFARVDSPGCGKAALGAYVVRRR